MTKEELEKLYEPEDGTIVLEPCEIYNEAIIGITEDKCHFVYSYEELLVALANDFKKEGDVELTDEDLILDAVEWLETNTIKSLPYMDSEFRPIIIFEKKYFTEG